MLLSQLNDSAVGDTRFSGMIVDLKPKESRAVIRLSAMNLQGLVPETQKIIRALEERSGFPVSFFEDPSLQMLATIRTGTATGRAMSSKGGWCRFATGFRG
jgi:hypothetical protein